MLDLVTLDLKLPLPTEGESYNPKLCHHISVYMFPKMNLDKNQSLAHLVYQLKSLIQSCFVHCCWHWCLCYLCTPSGTGLDIETSYFVYICTSNIL